MSYTPGCWFAANVIGCGSCDGQLVRCHLIPKGTIRRAWLEQQGLRNSDRRKTLTVNVTCEQTVWDKRAWVSGCGGPTGIGGHHGMLDHSRTLRIERRYLPPELEEFAAELGLGWWLEREYGPKEQAA